MVWQGANLEKAAPAGSTDDGGNSHPDSSSNPKMSQETVEAALNRLSKAYSSAMDCVGAWHRAEKSTTTPDELAAARRLRIASLRKIAQAARRTFEEAILLDPLVADEHAGLVCQTLWQERQETVAKGDDTHLLQRRQRSVELRSAGHKATAKQLAYLSLVNYADLLLAGCGSKRGDDDDRAGSSILDRGLVKSLATFAERSCWIDDDDTNTGDSSVEIPPAGIREDRIIDPPSDKSKDGPSSLDIDDEASKMNDVEKDLRSRAEPEISTIRLAVTAYVDASGVDGTDPTLWLKLACAARRLGRLVEVEKQHNESSLFCGEEVLPTPTWLLSFRRLERHALEKACSVLPSTVPPNRTAVSALEQWWLEEEESSVMEYSRQLSVDNAQVQHERLSLPRYSWSILGRILLRACKNGAPITSPVLTLHSASTPRVHPDHVFPPHISLHVSPLLALPSNVLGRICQYLDAPQISRFESTCRGLSALIISARATLDHQAVRRESMSSSQPRKRENNEQPRAVSGGGEVAVATGSGAGGGKAGSEEESAAAVDDEHEKYLLKNHRVSKRLQSQIITSGKRAERQSRRNSTDFCLLASTLGVNSSSTEYKKLFHAGFDWNAILPIGEGWTRPQRTETTKKVTTRRGGESNTSIDASLANFVKSWSVGPFMPIHVLFDFVAHVSLNVGDVFSSDPGGLNVLTSALLESFDILGRRSGVSEDMMTSFSSSGWQTPVRDACRRRIVLFAMDLLHAELCLRLCAFEVVVDTDFDSKSSFVGRIAPQLLDILSNVDDDISAGEMRREWIKLETRCYWLNAGFFLWRGRLSHNVSESREAEIQGLSAIQEAIRCLSLPEERPVLKIQTPHLVSPNRRGQHWRELSALSLENFSNDVKASSILLQVQERFLEVVSSIDEKDDQSILQQTQREALSVIGETLHARYVSSGDSASADYSELVADFLGEHGQALLTRGYGGSLEEDDADFRLWFDGLVPIAQIDKGRYLLTLQRPCIITILLCCLQTDNDRELDVLDLLMNMCTAITELAESTRVQLPDGTREICFESAVDSDEDSMASETSFDNGSTQHNTHRSKLRQYSVLLRLLVSKVTLLFTDKIVSGERGRSTRDGLVIIMYHILHFVSSWFVSIASRKNEDGDWIEDLRLYHAVKRLCEVIRARNCFDQSFAAQIYIVGLIGIVREQRRAISVLFQASCDRRGRSMRSKVVLRRADFVAALCCDLGLRLTEHPFRIVGEEMLRSSVFESRQGVPLTPHLAVLCESLLWLWRAVRGTEQLVDAVTGSKSETALDRLCIDRLRVPVGLAIIALSGSASSTQFLPTGDSSSQFTGLEDFCDSDNSALECLEEEDGAEDKSKRQHLLRVAGQVVHCIAQVFSSSIEEAEAVDYSYVDCYRSTGGPSLPLVAARVLNRLADRLLLDFAEEGAKDPLWADYPFGTRLIGRLLDLLLFKAYKCLHGFTLVNASDSKDFSSGTSSPTMKVKPESTYAAAQLYRCIVRAYSQGRKSPPKLALDTVLAALPPLESTPSSKQINEYLFSTGDSYSSLTGLASFINKGAKWEANFSEMRDLVLGLEGHGSLESEEEVLTVRRGISRLIAQGAIPQYVEIAGEDERTSTTHFEEELSRKFSAILDSLSLGNTDDYEAWYKAGQCLTVKADLIADRLGLSQGFCRSTHFTSSRRLGPAEALLGFDDLVERQFRETSYNDEVWTQCLGVDLSVFATSSWSSFASLQSCSKEVGLGYISRLGAGDNRCERDLKVWYEIEQMKQKGDYVGWQQAWGGLFVSGLRKIAFRCVRLALFILYSREDYEEDQNLVSEVVESLGMNLYTELMGSQVYGYPMRKMTSSRKRDLAQASLSCFERAVAILKTSSQLLRRHTWDLNLMIGKCHEKIAKTYWRECFRGNVTGSDGAYTRMYERSMSKAFHSYHASFVEAKELASQDQIEVESGGSSHGYHEVLYRLHASRLKCLIAGVDRTEDERELAETEAVRLTELYWYTNRGSQSDGELDIRDRIWNVLADVVTVLAQCRLDLPFFHRSVYRHAQALLWAPTLSDPRERILGSLGTVPATRAFKLRGLNSTDAASSAAVVMGSLFEKKRPQLCAVWVTSNSDESIFQTINSSVRKYDSLRGKYIAAYIDTLRLCNRKSELEMFLKWVYTTKRDLPSCFAASAATAGGKPQKTHQHDPLLVKSGVLSSYHLLTTVKRQANSALASVILHEIQGLAPKDAKKRENLLKLAYACYLRLNCRPSEVSKSRERRTDRSSGSVVVKALTAAYQEIAAEESLSGRPAEWGEQSQVTALLEGALKKCRDLFPTLSGNFYSNKGAKAKKDENTSKKRKVPGNETTRRSFEVAIPEGLSAGDKFLTSIQVGDKTKKVRLTVPQGASEFLRFSLHDNGTGVHRDSR